MANSLFWLFNKDGIYSVKSGCKIMREVSMQAESSMVEASELVWGKLWQMHIPNKIKVFG